MGSRLLEVPADAAAMGRELAAIHSAVLSAGLPPGIRGHVDRKLAKLDTVTQLDPAERAAAKRLVESLPRHNPSRVSTTQALSRQYHRRMIVSCGEALVDMVPHAVPGGGPMNVAIAAARLGAPAAFVGRLSTDEHGVAIWQHMASNSVDLRATERGDEPTARAIVEHVPELRFRFEGTNTADTNLGPVDLGILGQHPHIVHGGTLGLFRGRTADSLADLANRHDGIVSLDPNVRPQIIEDREGWLAYHERWVASAHVYRSSDEDAEWIWPGRDFSSCAEELLEGAAHAVVLTRGAKGATVFTRSGECSVAGQRTEVVDTVGAGDTFVASLLVSLLEYGLAGTPDEVADLALDTWSAMLTDAAAAAAVTCSRLGADPPYRAELPARFGSASTA